MLKKLINILDKLDKRLSRTKSKKNKLRIRKNIEQKSDLKITEDKEYKKNAFVKFFIKFIIASLILFVLGLLIGISTLIILFSYYAKDLPSIEDNKIIEQSTKILDRNGNLLYQVHGDINRTWIDLDNISPWVEKATLSLEDRNFYTHPGFDWKGLTRVVLTHGYNAIRKVLPFLPWKQTVGGSTITQQLVKNTMLSSEKTIKRKIQELLLARNIEQKYNKKDILELYLNYIPYGGNTYGIEAAAQKYFGISASSLTPAQAATLASLPQSPTYLSPYGNHIDKLMTRKKHALSSMLGNGLIEKAEYDDAIKEEITFQPFVEKIKDPHFVLYAKEKLTKFLTKKYSKEEAEFMVENGGLIVKTTLDPAVQAIAYSAVVEGINAVSNYNASNAALVAENPKNGQILAMVGSVDFFDSKNDGQVNVALAQRQPGSSIKPIIYTQAFLDGYSPATVVYDVKTDFGNHYEPNNYDLKFLGPISFRNSLAQSRNVPAVKALYLAGIKDSIDLARRMGITTWGDDAEARCGLSLVLGGCEVKLIDMVQAYSVLDNLGEKYSQSVILEIRNSEGKTLYQWEKPEPVKALDKPTAYQVINVMTDRSARLKTFGSSLDISRKAAVKTGTTNAYLDAWTLGFVPQITAGVWAGNNNPSSMKHGGSFVAAPIWKKFMNEVFKLPQYLQVEDWEEPEDITKMKVSTITGKLPSEFTPEDKMKEEIFTPTNLPSEIEPDTMFLTAEICDTSGLLATEYCPDYMRTTLVYTFHHAILPDLPNWEDAVQKWAKEHASEFNEQSEENENTLGKKIKYISDPSEIPLEYDTTYNSSSAKNAPKLKWHDKQLFSLGVGTNVFKIDIDAKNDLKDLNILLDNESVFRRKFIKDTNTITVTIFIDTEKHPIDSDHTLRIFVTDNKELRGMLQTSVRIKEDIYPPIVDNFLPEDKASISEGTSINISADISDNKNKLSKVEFYFDGKPLKVFTEGPYQYELTLDETIHGGTHIIKIRAFDTSGNMALKSHEISIR